MVSTAVRIEGSSYLAIHRLLTETSYHVVIVVVQVVHIHLLYLYNDAVTTTVPHEIK